MFKRKLRGLGSVLLIATERGTVKFWENGLPRELNYKQVGECDCPSHLVMCMSAEDLDFGGLL